MFKSEINNHIRVDLHLFTVLRNHNHINEQIILVTGSEKSCKRGFRLYPTVFIADEDCAIQSRASLTNFFKLCDKNDVFVYLYTKVKNERT